MNPQTIAASISAFVATVSLFVALFVVWIQRREASLRRGDVLIWTNEVISALESLLLICILNETQLDAETAKSKCLELIFNTSILVERGRIFFKNKVVDGHGREKEAAYRGYRPAILDPIVLAHKIACRLRNADYDTRLRMRLLAEDCLKKFVSLAQKEVGRDKTASAHTSVGGDSVSLSHSLESIDKQRLNRLTENKKNLE